MKRALLYYRVSTEPQATRGYGLERQKTACKEYVSKIGYEIFDEVIEQISGTVSIFERTDGKKIRELSERKEIDAVIIEKMDRLVRGDKSVTEYLELKVFCVKNGIELHFTSTGKDENTLVSDIMQIFEAHSAGADWSKIRRQMKKGKEDKARSGKWVGSSTSYGYRKMGKLKDTYLEIDEFETSIVQRIFTEYSGLGYDRPFTMREIMRGLIDDRIPAPCGRNWHAETILRIIQQRNYIGEFSYSGIVVNLTHLAIIDPDIWDAAQARRIRNKELYFRNPRNQYLLSGFLRCSCGAALCGNFSTKHEGGRVKTILRYQCSKGKNPYKQLFSDCREPLVSLPIADKVVWDWIEKICLDEEGLDDGLQLMMDQSEDVLAPKRKRLVELGELLEIQEKRIERVSNTLQNIDDDIAYATLEKSLKDLTKNREGLLNECDQLRAELVRLEITPAIVRDIKDFANQIRAKFINPDFETKRTLLDLLNFRGRLARDETGRYLDVSVGFKSKNLPLSVTSSEKNVESPVLMIRG